MDHETALERKACERYVLGELSEQERDEFEEHFFSCPECAQDVRAAAALIANMKAVFRETRGIPAPAPRLFQWPAMSRWLAVSAAVNVVLLVSLGSLVLKVTRRPPGLTAPRFYETFVIPGTARSPSSPGVIACSELCGLTFELDPDRTFQQYRYEIFDSNGSRQMQGFLPAPRNSDADLHLILPAYSLNTGRYWLVLRGISGNDMSEVARVAFTR